MALEPIDCTSHSGEIEEAYLKVVRGTDPDTTWLIISPNSKKEYVPEYTGTSFSEFLQTFEDVKVQYGLARVSPPGSDVEKLILVGWCPDSAPMKSRASFASNFGTVSNGVLQGYHVQVTARDEDDLDEDELLQKISNAAGARYSIQQGGSEKKPAFKKTVSPPAAKPTTTERAIPLKKTPVVAPKPQSKTPAPAPAPAPASTAKETEDWDEPELKERNLDEQPLARNQSSYKPIGKIDLQQVIREENAREDPRLVSSTSKNGNGPEMGATAGSKVDPDADIKALKEQSKMARDREINTFLAKKDSATPASTPSVVKSPAPTVRDASTSPVDDERAEDVSELKSRFEKLGKMEQPTQQKPESPIHKTSEPQIIQPQVGSLPPRADSTKRSTPMGPPAGRGIALPGMTKESQMDDEENEGESDGWDEEEPTPALPSRNVAKPEPEEPEKQEKESTPTLPPRNVTPPEEEEEKQEEQEGDEEQQQQQQQEEPPQSQTRRAVPPPPPRRAEPEPEPEEQAAPWALAEYDYDAGEENELTFVEKDKIINIEFVDDDWWLGELERNGEKGLFPSNYVSLQN
ncbi:Abp1p KNAG_0I02700 [Huiozyma naganishii CBS 8797]|uniref:Actin-binding protein n=1 Tax=Huiozyma naganishii (strain ATCC MYA-139 / BCRC 22969 / CBS 8797 / KCTC 17520 / NBRC 10181 / NCYC 3082 / Yp74L-3) TaxID=1071383 RepID=J7RB06_HUIN7|nr:hypothetical protein KNAG_0I02700 [Kazachstania naganishii CBS 8797]CCK72055.1 hypothetical protein KNAG_0I02700 [Kazachstania naganishii CBS 8797]